MLEDGRIIVGLAAVVGAGKNRVQLGVTEHIGAVDDRLVAAQNDLQVVFLEEALDALGTEAHDGALGHVLAVLVGLVLRVIDVEHGVGPEQVENEFLLGGGEIVVVDAERLLQLVDLVDFLESGADARVRAEDLAADDCAVREVLEDLVQLVEDRRGQVRVFLEPLLALREESLEGVDLLVLVRAAQQVDVVGELQLQGEEEADDFERVGAAVDVVAEEEVIDGFDVALVLEGIVVVGYAVVFEETEQVAELAVDGAEDLDARAESNQ